MKDPALPVRNRHDVRAAVAKSFILLGSNHSDVERRFQIHEGPPDGGRPSSRRILVPPYNQQITTPALDSMHSCTYNQSVNVEWDPLKAASNLEKHKIDFADAATVLSDERAITIRDEASAEERFVTLGLDALGRVLVVVYTWRQDRVRIISARKATPGERRRYRG